MSQDNGNIDRSKLPKGFVKILEDACKGCGLCIDTCPQNGLQLSNNLNRKGHRYVEQSNIEVCTGCSLCYIQCPTSAIVVYKLSKSKKEPVGKG